VRTAGDPLATVGAIREAVRTIDSNLPLMNISTQVEQVEKVLEQERLLAKAYALFGTLALLIASIGLFGLMSYSVARRTNEIGIRMALGAQRQHVLRLVMAESMTLVIAGIGIGIAVALAASRLVASLLFGLAPTDMLTMLTAVTVMIIVSTAAGYLLHYE
jgi:ABC-type antimicrobial peptide transport system permease subunit